MGRHLEHQYPGKQRASWNVRPDPPGVHANISIGNEPGPLTVQQADTVKQLELEIVRELFIDLFPGHDGPVQIDLGKVYQ
jgi:hypothetical protein